jgi:hypothetical protein
VMRVAGEMRRQIGAALGIDGEFEPALSVPPSFAGGRMDLERTRFNLRHGLGDPAAL